MFLKERAQVIPIQLLVQAVLIITIHQPKLLTGIKTHKQELAQLERGSNGSPQVELSSKNSLNIISTQLG